MKQSNKQYITLKECEIIRNGDNNEVNFGYAISFDEMNIVLNKVGVNLTKDSKNYQQTTYTPISYYPNLSACIRGMVNKELLVEANKGVENMKELEGKIDKFCTDVWSNVNLLIQDLKKGCLE